MVAQLRPIPPDRNPSARLDQIAARRAELAAELVALASEETAIVHALADRAARQRPVALTVSDLAAEMQVDPKTIRRWIRDGLPAVRPGGTSNLMVLLDDLSAWLRQGSEFSR